jgi:hypothetical protein
VDFSAAAARLRTIASEVQSEGEKERREVAGRCREIAFRIGEMAKRLDRVERFKNDPPEKWFS